MWWWWLESTISGGFQNLIAIISRVEAAMIAFPFLRPGLFAPPLDVSSLNLVPFRCCTGKCVEVGRFLPGSTTLNVMDTVVVQNHEIKKENRLYKVPCASYFMA